MEERMRSFFLFYEIGLIWRQIFICGESYWEKIMKIGKRSSHFLFIFFIIYFFYEFSICFFQLDFEEIYQILK